MEVFLVCSLHVQCSSFKSMSILYTMRRVTIGNTLGKYFVFTVISDPEETHRVVWKYVYLIWKKILSRLGTLT